MSYGYDGGPNYYKDFVLILVFSTAVTLFIGANFPLFLQSTFSFLNEDRPDSGHDIYFTADQLDEINSELDTGWKALTPRETGWCLDIDYGKDFRVVEIVENNESQQGRFSTSYSCPVVWGTLHTHPTLWGSSRPSKTDLNNTASGGSPSCVAHGKIAVDDDGNVSGIYCLEYTLKEIDVKTHQG